MKGSDFWRGRGSPSLSFTAEPRTRSRTSPTEFSLEANGISRDANRIAEHALKMQEDEGRVRIVVEPRMMVLVGDGEDDREALRLARAGLSTGTMTTLDVLHAQSVVARARHRHAEAVVGYNRAQVDLLAALGLLDENSLGLDRAPLASSSDSGD